MSIKNRTGYFFHQQSIQCPEVPRTFLNEFDTQTCGHCSVQVILNPERKRERGWCHQCDRYLCDNCNLFRANGGPCVPREQRAQIVFNNPLMGWAIDANPTEPGGIPQEALEAQKVWNIGGV